MLLVRRVADDDQDGFVGLDAVGGLTAGGDRLVDCGDLALLGVGVLEGVGDVQAQRAGVGFGASLSGWLCKHQHPHLIGF